MSRPCLSDLLDPGFPVVPVVVLDDPGLVPGLLATLEAASVRVVEVALRTPRSAEVLAAATRAAGPSVVVGAGTVLDEASLRSAVAAGARFAASPGLVPEVAAEAERLGVPLLPGVMTPGEALAAARLGLAEMKFFPADAAGGPAALAAYADVLPVRFVPTGGVDDANVADYLSLPNVVGCGGSWCVAGARSGDWDAVGRALGSARRAVATAGWVAAPGGGAQAPPPATPG